MKGLRQIMFSVIGRSLALLALACFLVGAFFILQHAFYTEQYVAQRNALRVYRMLESELNQLGRITVDWAFWDDLYNYVEEPTENFYTANFIPETFASTHLDLALLINQHNEIVHALVFDEEKFECVDIAPSWLEALRPYGVLERLATREDSVLGFVRIETNLFIICALPILPSSEQGVSRGTFLFGRKLDPDMLTHLERSALAKVRILWPESHGPSRSIKEKMEGIAVSSCYPDWRTVAGCFALHDPLGNIVAVIECAGPRTPVWVALRHLGIFALLLIAVGGGAVYGSLLWLDRLVLKRTAEIHQFVQDLRTRETLSERISVKGTDELAAFAESLNLLLDKLEKTMGELRAAQADLETQRTFLRNLLDAHPGYIWVVNREGRIVFANRGFADLLGLPTTEIVGRPFETFFEEAQDKSLLDDQREAAETGMSRFAGCRLAAFRNAPQRWLDTYFVPLRTAEGAVERVLAVAVDVTETKEAREALQQSEERYRKLFENAPVAIILWDNQYRVIGWNPHAENLLGLEKREVLWQPWVPRVFLASDREKVSTALRQVIEGHGPVVQELAIQSRDGELRYCIWHHSKIGAPDGEFVAGLSFATDVTEQRRAEEERRRLEAQVQQAQKLESLGILAGGIAHDFNNILMAILGNADLALSEVPANSPVRTTLDEIILGARRASDLCRQLLAYSGHGRFVIEPVNLSKLVTEMTRMLEVAITKKATLRVECPSDLPTIEADATQIRQVVMNLVMNASEALGEHAGVITVRTGVKECSREFLDRTLLGNRLPPKLYVYLEVMDTGCGMDKETLSRIFEPFFSTKFMGRGLGLAAVLGIVRSHDGAIEVHSEVGKGTTFRIYFPASDKTAEPADSPAVASAWHGSGTILVVDDEETVRVLASRMLERCGFKVIQATNGQEALDLVHAHAKDLTAILLDLSMPHLDGYEALTEIRRVLPTVPVVLSSGYPEEELARRFSAFNNLAFLEKPYTRTTLITAFRKVLHT